MDTGSPQGKRKALGAPVTALFVALLIVVAAFVYVSFSPKQVSSTSSRIASSVSATVASTSSTSYNTATSVNTNSSSRLLARCSSAQSAFSQNNSVQWIGTVVAGTVSPAILCFQLYYFSVTPETFNLTAGETSAGLSIWSVTGPYNSGVPTVRGADSNFTVSSSRGDVMMGGPANMGEGTVVAYSILANPGVTGTFWLGFGFQLRDLPILMESQTAEGCPWYGQVVAGNVSPISAFPPSGCSTIADWPGYCSSTTNSSSSQCSTIPGVPYQLIPGRLFFRIVSVSNSAQ